MSLTSTQLEVYSYCEKNDFVSSEKIEDFSKRLDPEGHLGTLSLALEKFLSYSCPKCSAEGAYKWHFLGKLRRPSCDFTWYVRPGTYAAEQFQGVFRSGISAGASISSDAEKKGDKAGGCMGAIFGFVFVAIFRLIFALLMIPIQAIISLTQKKPESKSLNQARNTEDPS